MPVGYRGPCVNCRRKAACRPRGLCHGCDRNPEVRGRFPKLPGAAERSGRVVCLNCDKLAPGGRALERDGWKRQRVHFHGVVMLEVLCAGCFAEHGFQVKAGVGA